MKKLFTLLTLALLSIGTAWADDITVTWLPNNAASVSAAGTASVDDVLTISDLTTSTPVTFQSSLTTYDSKNWGQFISSNRPSKNYIAATDYIAFTVTIGEGVTFTPTSATAYGVGIGTGNNGVGIYSAIQGADKKSAAANSSNAATVSQMNVSLTGSYTAGQTFTFYIHIGQNNTTANKGIALRDVVLTGTYTKVAVTTYDLTTTADPAAGGVITRSPNQAAFSAGRSVTLTATPNYGYEFVNWTKGGVEQGTATTLEITTAAAEEEYVAHFNALTTYPLTTTANPVAGGTITRTDNHAEYLAGDNVTLTAVPAAGYYFINWTKGGSEVSTDAAYEITTASAAEEYVANFGKLFTVTYDIDDYDGTVGKVLNNYREGVFNEKYADKTTGNYTIPAYAHRLLYKEGHVLTGWTDGVNTYNTGDVITLTNDITLSPVWAATTASLSDSQAESVVTWNFRFSQILFNAWQGGGAIGYYTKPQTVNGELIAVPMIIDATSGKVDNSGRSSNDNAQVNAGTKFTIPAVSGMKIEIPGASTNFSTTTIAGSTEYEGTGTKSISYTYTGTDETIDIVINESNQYLKTITVTYPVTASAINIIPAYDKTTYVTPAALDFSAVSPAGLKAYVATNATNGSVTLEEVTTVPAKTPLMLIGTAATDYSVSVISSASAPAQNMFVAGDGKTTFDGSTFDYILYTDGKFHQVISGKVPVGKAYLHCDSDPTTSSAPYLTFNIGNLTGISTTVKNNEDIKNVFDLQGRKVAQPVKGLYILNGKKVVIK